MFFLIRHFCTFSLHLNSINCDHKHFQLPIEKNIKQSDVIINKNNSNKLKKIFRLFCFVYFVLFFFFKKKRKHDCIFICIYLWMSIIRTIHGNAISKERKCARFKEKYFFKKLTKHRFQSFSLSEYIMAAFSGHIMVNIIIHRSSLVVFVHF